MFGICFWCVLCSGFVSSVVVEEPQIISVWRDFPSKTLLNTTSVRPECAKAYTNFVKLLNENDLNALKMLDATAKLPSGILNGNVIQYGDYDECMEVADAQYCLVEVDLEPLWKKSKFKHKELVHSHYFFKGTFDAPAHRIPEFTMLRWGFCIPRECSSSDLQSSLQDNVGVLTQIRPGMCQKSVKDTKPLTLGDYVARIFFGILFVVVSVASSLDYLAANSSPKNDGIMRKFLMCFSLKQNMSKFLEIKSEDRNEIAGLHGIRALNVLALLMSHKAISLFFNPFMNRTSTVNRLSQPWTIIAKNAIVYTDSFLLISGLLNANALLTDLHNGRTMNFKDKLINRIFRILPNVVALILFCTYILPLMGSGPLWPTIVDYHSVLCKQYMWRNLLFIHNYFGFENMCLTHTHQLGIDMQLFLATPILIYLMWNHKRIGFYVLTFVAFASTILRFWVAYENELSSVIYFGITVQKMFSTANLSYILPTHRATIYLMGVYLAYFLKFSKQNATLNTIPAMFLWCFFVPIFLWTWMGSYHMVQKDYVYNNLEGSFISAISPVLWGASLSFGIYAVNNNIAGWFGDFLCWRYFQIVTKLAYALYLVQFPVFFYNVGVTRDVIQYQPHFQLQILETTAIILCSFVLVICIEMPCQNIRKILFDKKKIEKETSNNRVTTIRQNFKTG